MAERTLDFYQIIFNESQREKCYPFAKVYFNETYSDYFENSVIADLVPRSQADFISVCSWRLAQKRGDSSTPMVLNGKLELTEEKILSNDFDIAVLTPRSPRHQPLLMASQWHGSAWDNAFNILRKDFFPSVGIKIKSELSKSVYENHFVAKKEIYHAYAEVLKRAIAFMAERDVFFTDSGYIRKKRDQKEIKAYQEKSGRQDWPIAPFILERLFSCFIEGKDYNIINL